MMPRLPHKTCPKASRHLLRGGGTSHKQSNWVNPSRPKKTQRESPYLIPPPAFCMDSGKKEWGGRRSNNAGRHSRGTREDRRRRIGAGFRRRVGGRVFAGCLPSSRGSPRGTNVVKLNLLLLLPRSFPASNRWDSPKCKICSLVQLQCGLL